MTKRITILTLLCVASIITNAQTKKQSFWDRITIRKAFETKSEDDSKPATIAFTIPSDTVSSWLLNGGIGIQLADWQNAGISPKRRYEMNLFGVYNHNSLIDKKQHNLKIGGAIRTDFLLRNSPNTITGNTSVQYLRNYVDTTHAAILTSYWNPFIKTRSKLFFHGYGPSNGPFEYFLATQLGPEYQQVKSENSSRLTGKDIRLYHRLGANVMLKRKWYEETEELRAQKIKEYSEDSRFKNFALAEIIERVNQEIPDGTREAAHPSEWIKFIELSVNYHGRNALWRKNSTFESYNRLFTADLNLYPLNSNNFSIGISYNNGTNPINGTLDQTFWVLSVSFKR